MSKRREVEWRADSREQADETGKGRKTGRQAGIRERVSHSKIPGVRLWVCHKLSRFTSSGSEAF